MATKPDSNRLVLENYPYQWVIDTTFGDMDIAGHINNVALARYYETCRSRWLITLTGNNDFFKSDITTVIAEYTIRFLGEVNFPDQVTVGIGIGRIGNSSFSSQQALFVNGQCVGLSDAAMVLTSGGNAHRIDDEMRQKMAAFLLPLPEQPLSE